MATKNISITEEAYKILAKKKMVNESFSKVIVREIGKRDIMDFAGILSSEEADELEENIRKIREIKEKGYKKRIERLKSNFN